MNNVSFEMVGKISIGKESENFSPYEEAKYPSGWVNKTLKFNCISGNNRFMLQSKAGYFEDMHNDIYLFSKDGKDDNGKVVKGKGFKIPFKNRLNTKLDDVVEWKKFIIDLDVKQHRWDLEHALDKLKEGREFTEDELEKLGVKSPDELEAAYEKSLKKRKEFVSEYDYIDFIRKMVESGNYKDKKFNIRGNYEMQYSEKNNRFYCNYVPTRIYLAEDDAKETATANLVIFYGQDGLDDGSVEDLGKYFVSGFVQVYDSPRKGNVFAPYTITFYNENEKLANKLVKMFTIEDEDEVKELGIVVDLINGSQTKKIEMDDLDEETQDNILCGLTTLEDVQKELGGNVYGDRVVENRFAKLLKGYSHGEQETSYTSEDFVIKSLDDGDVFEDDDSDDNLFDESDDDLFS